LTFDVEHPDRPTHPGLTEKLLDLLGELDVRSTMFVQGRWAQAYPKVARRIAPEGHLVGNHSHFHARMPMLTGRGLRSDVQSAEAAIRQFCGADPRPWFRCPFGAGGESPDLLDGLDRLGYREVGWSVDGHDWAHRSGPPVIERAVRGVLAHGDGAVVLFHGWPRSTPAALPEVVRQLRAAGAEFVRLDELDALPKQHGAGPSEATSTE
jgi:peptidoglycan/xylan/chitin deacetylase (PgdA/CDA1 family)